MDPIAYDDSARNCICCPACFHVFMRVIAAVLLLSALPILVMAQSSDSLDFRLDAHRWEHRLLLVFVPEDDAEAKVEQENLLAETGDGFRDRDLLLITVQKGTEGTVRKAPGAAPSAITQAAVDRLYRRIDVPPDEFRVVLVGKDGTEKQRAVAPVSPRAIFDTIDSMPMRQRELRERGDSDGGS